MAGWLTRHSWKTGNFRHFLKIFTRSPGSEYVQSPFYDIYYDLVKFYLSIFALGENILLILAWKKNWCQFQVDLLQRVINEGYDNDFRFAIGKGWGKSHATVYWDIWISIKQNTAVIKKRGKKKKPGSPEYFEIPIFFFFFKDARQTFFFLILFFFTQHIHITNMPAPTIVSTATTVQIHPLVLLSATDHYNRVAKDTKKRVVGVLLGQQKGKTVNVANSFAGK